MEGNIERRNAEIEKRIVKVVVLGDIGRSPRMQYHALSLAENNLTVRIIGYKESNLLPELIAHPNVIIDPLNHLSIDRGPRIIQYFLKALWQFITFFFTLLTTGPSDYLLCQNPPAIPTLPTCWFYCLLTNTIFYIDWHNYAYSIMALGLSSSHPLLSLSTKLEKYYGKKSKHNFCVTQAMQVDLGENWNINASVLYDRPPKIFRPISLEEKHEWFLKLSSIQNDFAFSGHDNLNLITSHSKTAFTYINNGVVELMNGRPGLLFSSTSWTPDEDFGILLHALQVYENSYDTLNTLPKLVCVITGKGPMKQHYIDLIATKHWKHVKVITPWLEAADYPKMVASADLGVCLHTSSSGLDLPMKVVDMFGAGLPVCAFNFKCLNELVKNNINGYTFNNSSELSQEIITWFKDFPNNGQQNAISQRMKAELTKFQALRWEKNWNDTARKYFISPNL